MPTNGRAPLLRRLNTRHISPNTSGMICLTLLIASWWLTARRESRQEIGKPTEIVVAERRPARADHHRGIVRLDVGPVHRHAGELARVVVEVDAVLTPRLSTIDQAKRTPMQRVEGMRDPKDLWLTRPEWCNRLLMPRAGSSGITGPIRIAS